MAAVTSTVKRYVSEIACALRKSPTTKIAFVDFLKERLQHYRSHVTTFNQWVSGSI